MAPLVMGLGALALEYGPGLARWIFGDNTGAAAQQAADVVRTVTGTDDAATAAAVLADPAKASKLRIRLAEVAAQREAAADQVRLETFRAVVADAANARAASSASPLIARAQVTLAAVITLMFGLTLVLAATRGVPPGIDLLLGALIAAFAGVTAFFFGNSTSGHTANNTLAALAGRPTAPAAIATTGTVVVPGQPSPPGTSADALMAAFNRPRS
jgi:hypothetical protein